MIGMNKSRLFRDTVVLGFVAGGVLVVGGTSTLRYAAAGLFGYTVLLSLLLFPLSRNRPASDWIRSFAFRFPRFTFVGTFFFFLGAAKPISDLLLPQISGLLVYSVALLFAAAATISLRSPR